MVILGIDPGTARTGWGVIKKQDGVIVEYVAHGCIITPKEMEMGKRLVMLRRQLRKLITTFAPESVAIERLFFGRNIMTATTVGQAKGVIIMTLAEYSLPTFEYTGPAVKLFVTGDGRADKKVVQKYIRSIFKRTKRHLPFSTKDKAFDDAADGLAIAILHASRAGLDTANGMKGEKSATRKAL